MGERTMTPSDRLKSREDRCAELLAKMRQFGKTAKLGGVMFVKPGEYTRDERRVVNESLERLGLNVSITEGEIHISGSQGVPTPLFQAGEARLMAIGERIIG